MKMEMAMVEEVASKLAQREEVADAIPDTGQKGPYVRCIVRTRQQERDVKRDLHEYPVYVALEVQ